MDNALFRKLQDAIEHPTRSKDWFGMAEQAINTIYALGERPDVICDKIIRNLTRRAFASRSRAKTPPPQKDPDAMDEDEAEEGADPSQADSSNSQSDEPTDNGDAFVLSQLLFVVGHVAIKHIVYLELVEREWKRQKHEKEAGMWW